MSTFDEPSYPMGWVYQPEAIEAVLADPNLRAYCGLKETPIRGTWNGETVLQWQAIQQVAGYQPWVMQQSGDCVGCGMALALNGLIACEIANLKQPEMWVAEVASEPIYAFARIEIGKGRLGAGAGAVVAYAAQACQELGLLIRQKYTVGGKDYDLSTYDVRKADGWGRPRAGVPDDLEPEAAKHKVKRIAQLKDFAECADAIFNGYAVSIGSNRGFRTVRDSEGFMRPAGSWAHNLAYLGVRGGNRPGLATPNSWGQNWITGPKWPDDPSTPDWIAWVDSDVIDGCCRSGDAWALSDLDGFPRKKRDWVVV